MVSAQDFGSRGLGSRPNRVIALNQFSIDALISRAWASCEQPCRPSYSYKTQVFNLVLKYGILKYST